MLTRLYVKNYALIKELVLNFDQGLTIITGETGAGKSIIMGALGLILGNRADSTTLLDKSQKCIVEGAFRINDAVRQSLSMNDVDIEDVTIFRREIVPEGRSRSFINDTPVTLEQMKEIGSRLIDIHSQHQALMLGDNSFQLGIIDSFASHTGLLTEYRNSYDRYRDLLREYNELEENAEKNKSDYEYFSYQLKQLEEARLYPDEENELKVEQELLSHAGEIHDSLAGSSEILSGDEMSVVSNLNEVRRILERIRTFYPDVEEILKRLEGSAIELNDLANETGNKAGKIEADPSRLEKVDERLDQLYSLMQKHRVESSSELIRLKDEIGSKVESLVTSDERLEEIKEMLDKNVSMLSEMASEISENRNSAMNEVEDEMSRLLKQLGMPNGRFGVRLTTTPTFTATGKDYAEFMFTANKQTLPENIAKVASGGELSRVMLSLKSLFTDNRNLPTIFFDEIDAGVSGEVATRVGEILALMGTRMQVINITHLPQVAALGHTHYYVYKEDDEASTITRIKLLNKKERLHEVARLLSGNEVTAASIANAKELIKGGPEK
ncbi:MAG TPA: DNA repair protein RecN [Bacteroidales bacterium]|nr:DNA repair protein RecN [Bacteroidales bacterium]